MQAIEIIKNEEYTEQVKSPQKTKVKLIVITVLILFAMIGMFLTAFSLFYIKGNKIIPGVSIREIDVGGLTQEEAVKKIEEVLNKELKNEIILQYEGFTSSIKPEQIDFEYNINEAVKSAYQKGRENGIIENNYKIIKTCFNKIDINLTYNYNSEKLNTIIAELEPQLPTVVQQPTYYIENGNIILNPGKQGTLINKEKLNDALIEAILKKGENEKNIQIPVDVVQPSSIDVDKFHELIYVEPQNAYYTKDPFVIHPEVIGVDFDVNKVKQMLQEYQEQYIIKLKYTIPEFTKNQIGTEAFPDMLSSFSTKYHSSDKSRTTNLKIASSKINGIVLMPGEEFSYNKTLGPRTTATGYKNGKIFSNGQVVDGIGGGICQISSTLYNAVLYANLEVTERRNHQFVPSYLKAGLDATVVYGSQDFKFKNSRNYPIKIVSEVSNGIAKIEILGIKEDIEYEIKIQPIILKSNSNNIKSVTYKYRYLNGNQIDKIEISRDTYKKS